MAARTLWYIEEFTDESMPCEPSLESWAAWLAEPDDECGRPEAAISGQTFRAYTMERHADVVAQFVDGALVVTPDPHPGADFFAVAYPGGGWDIEASGETPLGALGGGDVVAALELFGDAPVELAVCTQVQTYHMLRFELTESGPQLIDEGVVQ